MAGGFGGRSFVGLFNEDILCLRSSVEEGVKSVVRKMCWF